MLHKFIVAASTIRLILVQLLIMSECERERERKKATTEIYAKDDEK